MQGGSEEGRGGGSHAHSTRTTASRDVVRRCCVRGGGSERVVAVCTQGEGAGHWVWDQS